MGADILEGMKQVGIFMVGAQVILHFKASENYGKYLRLLMGLMVLSILFIPIPGMLKGMEEEDFYEMIGMYDARLSADLEMAELTEQRVEEKMEELARRAAKEAAGNETFCDEAVCDEAVAGNVTKEAEKEAGQNMVEEIKIEVKLHEENQLETDLSE